MTWTCTCSVIFGVCFGAIVLSEPRAYACMCYHVVSLRFKVTQDNAEIALTRVTCHPVYSIRGRDEKHSGRNGVENGDG